MSSGGGDRGRLQHDGLRDRGRRDPGLIAVDCQRRRRASVAAAAVFAPHRHLELQAWPLEQPRLGLFRRRRLQISHRGCVTSIIWRRGAFQWVVFAQAF